MLRFLGRACLVACSAVGFISQASAELIDLREFGCEFSAGKLGCQYGVAAYRIRKPPNPTWGKQIPVVVALHDAGGSGLDITRNENLVQAFLAAGFAVIAPDASVRHLRALFYNGNRPGEVRGQRRFLRGVRRNKKKFSFNSSDDSSIYLTFGKETGWYYYNIDRIYYLGTARDVRGFGFDPIYSETEVESDYIGRDEAQVLRDILEDASNSHGTDRHPTLIMGLGHGGSLVWQFACYFPELATLYAPINGAFWQNVPRNCRAGAQLVHTHSLSSTFWPIEGAKGNPNRYARTSVHANLRMLAQRNSCSGFQEVERASRPEAQFKLATGCRAGGPIELILAEEAFAFQDWWLDEMLQRIGVREAFESETLEEEPRTGPAFRRHGEADESPEGGALFKRPGARSGERFKSSR